MTPALLTAIRQLSDQAAQILAAAATLEYRAGAAQNIPDGYHEVLELIVLAVARRLEAAGHSKPDALRIGFEAAEEVRFVHGGLQFYIPKGDNIHAGQAEAEIFARFDGRNCAALASQYRKSEQAIYDIVRRQRALAEKGRQEGLFDGDSPRRAE